MNVGTNAGAWAERGCFERGNVTNNMLEDGDNDTKDGDKAPRLLTTTMASELGK